MRLDPTNHEIVMSHDTNEYLTAACVAARIGVTRWRVNQLQRASELPPPDARAGHNGTASRWRPETLAPWLALYDERKAWNARRRAMRAALVSA